MSQSDIEIMHMQLRLKWFGSCGVPVTEGDFTYAAQRLESMAQEIERLKAKLAKQDD